MTKRCGAEKVVQHRGKAWSTTHVCKRLMRHKGRHACCAITATEEPCNYRWPRRRKDRRALRRREAGR